MQIGLLYLVMNPELWMYQKLTYEGHTALLCQDRAQQNRELNIPWGLFLWKRVNLFFFLIFNLYTKEFEGNSGVREKNPQTYTIFFLLK